MFNFELKTNSFDKGKILNLFNENLSKYKNEEEIKKIVEGILDKELFYIYSSSNPYQGNFDFSFSYQLIEQAKSFLKNSAAEFFQIYVSKDENFSIEVDEDYDTYLIKSSLIEKNTKLIISNMLPDVFSVENILIKNKIYIDDSNEKWNFLEKYEDLTKVNTSYYQIGGFQSYFVQGEYNGFIGHFDGDYGDSGVLSIYIQDNEINSQVDMH